MGFDWNWALVIAGALMVLVEVALGGFAGFDLALIGSSFALGGAAGLVARSEPIGLAVAGVLCLAYLAAGRRWVRRRIHVRTTPSNADALIGRRALVTERVETHGAGLVKLEGEVWRAVPAAGASGPFEAGVEVTIEGVNGVTLLVR